MFALLNDHPSYMIWERIFSSLIFDSKDKLLCVQTGGGGGGACAISMIASGFSSSSETTALS